MLSGPCAYNVGSPTHSPCYSGSRSAQVRDLRRAACPPEPIVVLSASAPLRGAPGGSALVVHSLIPPSHLLVLQMSSRVGFLFGGGEGPFGFYAY